MWWWWWWCWCLPYTVDMLDYFILLAIINDVQQHTWSVGLWFRVGLLFRNGLLFSSGLITAIEKGTVEYRSCAGFLLMSRDQSRHRIRSATIFYSIISLWWMHYCLMDALYLTPVQVPLAILQLHLTVGKPRKCILLPFFVSRSVGLLFCSALFFSPFAFFNSFAGNAFVFFFSVFRLFWNWWVLPDI